MPPTILALGGSLTRNKPHILREDIGKFSLPFTVVSYSQLITTLHNLPPQEKVVLMGFSKGGGQIADASIRYPDKIEKAVLYESPLGVRNNTGGTFPVLIIWNDKGRKTWPSAKKAYKAWKRDHTVITLEGRGGHFRTDQNLKPKIRHAWDQALNFKIVQFILNGTLQ